MNQDDFLESFFNKIEDEIMNESFINQFKELVLKDTLSKDNYNKLIDKEFNLVRD